jgi:hypothetical protein
MPSSRFQIDSLHLLAGLHAPSQNRHLHKNFKEKKTLKLRKKHFTLAIKKYPEQGFNSTLFLT